MIPTLELFLQLQNRSTDTSGAEEKVGNYTLSSPEKVLKEVFKEEGELEEQLKREHATQLLIRIS